MINGVLHRPAGWGARYNVQELTRFFDIKSARNAFSAFDTNVSFIIKIIYFKCFTSANAAIVLLFVGYKFSNFLKQKRQNGVNVLLK